MKDTFRILLFGVALVGFTVSGCIQNPMTPEDPDEPGDEVPNDSSSTSIADGSTEEELPPIRFVRPDR